MSGQPRTGVNRTLPIVLFAMTAGILAIAAAALALRQEASAADVPVGAVNFAFTPDSVTLNVGDRVSFSNTNGIHGVAFVGFTTPAIPLNQGDSGTTNPFNEEGTFYYYCTVHAGPGLANEAGYNGPAMVGRVIVGEGGGPPATNTPAPTSTATQTPPVDTPVPTSTAVRGDQNSHVPGAARE